jgi:hypothetical protein
VAIGRRPASAEAEPGGPYGLHSGGEQRHRRSDDERSTLMSAQTGYLQPDAIGVFPAILLLLVIILAMLGVAAHAAFV